MFSFEELCQLIRIVADSKVAGVEMERDGMRVRIEGVPAPTHVAAVGPTLLPAHVVSAAAHLGAGPLPSAHAERTHGNAATSATEEEAGASCVTSPIVGTFYRAPNPDAEPYVKVGDVVTKGQTLCIIEAMKLMNEIEADISGKIVRIYPENAQPVEFGQPLFAIRQS